MYTAVVKNITLSADERLIEQARATARSRKTTLNAEFRKWLETYAAHATKDRQQLVRDYDALMKRLSYVNTGGRKFTRDEMNER